MGAIDRRLAQSVLAEVLESPLALGSLGAYYEGTNGEGDLTQAAVERLMIAALDVKRRNTRDHGEVITITYRIPPDPADEDA